MEINNQINSTEALDLAQQIEELKNKISQSPPIFDEKSISLDEETHQENSHEDEEYPEMSEESTYLHMNPQSETAEQPETIKAYSASDYTLSPTLSSSTSFSSPSILSMKDKYARLTNSVQRLNKSEARHKLDELLDSSEGLTISPTFQPSFNSTSAFLRRSPYSPTHQSVETISPNSPISEELPYSPSPVYAPPTNLAEAPNLTLSPESMQPSPSYERVQEILSESRRIQKKAVKATDSDVAISSDILQFNRISVGKEDELRIEIFNFSESLDYLISLHSPHSKRKDAAFYTHQTSFVLSSRKKVSFIVHFSPYMPGLHKDILLLKATPRLKYGKPLIFPIQLKGEGAIQ